MKFLFGIEEKSAKGNLRYFPLYAIKTNLGSEKAALEGDGVEEARQDFDESGKPAIKMVMTNTGAKIWAKMTAKNVGRPIAIALDDIVYSAPNVNGAIEGGNSEISGKFSVEEAQDLAKEGKIDSAITNFKQAIELGSEGILFIFHIYPVLLTELSFCTWALNS